jgi:mannose-1-phosphate guanylyltransferase
VDTHVVVIAGGAGTRFWPSGRRARPKQLLPISSDRTMLAETLARCDALAPPERTWIVTNRIQVDATRRECPLIPAGQVVSEPMMRNTAAAIGLAAGLISARDPDAVMVVVPADHSIRPKEVFVSTFLAAAKRAAAAEVLLTVGILPTGPATGYGYIEAADQVATIGEHPVHKVRSFKEKPDAATAAEFIASGRYFWNSGMFVWRVRTLLAAFERHLPGHFRLLSEILPKPELAADDYARFESVPIDIGIMERADNVEVIPASFEWDDVGSWLAMDRLHARDGNDNVIRGLHVGIDTRNCIVVGQNDHVVATLGIEDLIVIQTPDATFVGRKDRAEDVRRIVERLKEQGLDRYT